MFELWRVSIKIFQCFPRVTLNFYENITQMSTSAVECSCFQRNAQFLTVNNDECVSHLIILKRVSPIQTRREKQLWYERLWMVENQKSKSYDATLNRSTAELVVVILVEKGSNYPMKKSRGVTPLENCYYYFWILRIKNKD